MIIKAKKLVPAARLPEYKTHGSAGADLFASENTMIGSGDVRIVATGIAIEVPPGHEAQIRPRSGLAAKDSVTVLNAPGTIDSDYRGEVKVIMINHGEKPFIINIGDRIAQMVIARVEQAMFTADGELSDTARGTGGFGSTGAR